MNRKSKFPSTPRINDQVCPPSYDAKNSPAVVEKESPEPNAFVRTSYLPGTPARMEPAKLPRLFIQGGRGGSIKMDLTGVGVWLDQSAFAFTMPDESLDGLDIHAGDIAMIEPRIGALMVGSLVLVRDGSEEVLRQITSLQGGVWVRTASRTGAGQASSMPGSLLGVALGVLRLFRELKPVIYQREDFQYEPPPEVSAATIELREGCQAAKPLPPKLYLPSDRPQGMSETKGHCYCRYTWQI